MQIHGPAGSLPNWLLRLESESREKQGLVTVGAERRHVYTGVTVQRQLRDAQLKLFNKSSKTACCSALSNCTVCYMGLAARGTHTWRL